jgi:hypothetical protein
MAKKVKAEKAAGPAKIRLRMGKDKGLYALGKLAEAADELVTGAGPIRARLKEAFRYLVPVPPNEIPDEELRRIFADEVVKALTSEQAQGDEGRLEATLRITSDEDASVIARRILELYLELDRRLLR